MSTSARLSRPELQQDTEADSQTGAVSLLAATSRILERIVAGASLTDILTNLCAAIDDLNPDVASDPLWSGLRDGQSREAVLAHGLQAAWSQPLISKDNEVPGTFGLCHGTPRSPIGRELRLIEDAANIAVIAIEGERSQA